MSLIKPTPVFGEKQPPPPEFKEQFLFLLEFYIYEIRGERLAKLNQMFFVPTCVNFHFLDFKDNDLEITPVNLMFEPQIGISDDIEYFYAGRSVMFSVGQNVVAKRMSEFKIKLNVRKKMPEQIKPDVFIGEGEIDMTMQFAALRKEMFNCWHVGVPPPQIFENEIPLFFKDEEIGGIKVFIRLSSYGQSITTEFEAPTTGEKSFVFKGNKINDKSLSYKCRIIDSREIDICENSETSSSRASFQNRHSCAPCGLNFAVTTKSSGASSMQTKITGNDAANCNKDNSRKQIGPIQSSRGPSQPCGKAVVLKVSGLLDVGDGNKQPTVTVAPESDATNNLDPDHDIFILRIGKKGLVGPNEKSDLQLEMKTPKGPERGPPIRQETREAQTEDETSAPKKVKTPKKKKKKK